MKFAIRIGILAALSAILFVHLAGGQGKGKKSDKGPDIDITAPRLTPPESVPPMPDLPPSPAGDAARGAGRSPFSFSGSPFGQFGGDSSSITGAPIPIFDSNRAVTALDSTRISQQAAGTTPEILEMTPGVYIQRTNAGGGSAIVRGRNGNQNLILIDGVPINDSGWRFGNVQYLNTVDPGVIERIEVIRGPASVLYGTGATGGVINIITKSRKSFTQQFDWNGGVITRFSSAQNSIYNNLFVEGNVRNIGVHTGGSYLSTGALDGGGDAFFPNAITGYDQRAAHIRADALLRDGWVFTVNYQHLLQPSVPRTDRFPDSDVDPLRFRNRPTFFTPQERNFAYFRLSRHDEHDILSGLQFTFSLQERREGVFETRFDRADQRMRTSLDRIFTGGLDLRGYTNLSRGHTLTYGVTYFRDHIDAQRQQATNMTPFVPITPTLPDDGVYEQFGVFLLDRLQPTDWLVLTAGVRFSDINARGTAGAMSQNEEFFERNFTDWSSEFGAVVALTDHVHWTATIAEGFRAPNLDDLGSNDLSTGRGQDFGTSTLDPERALNYETGLNYLGPLFAGGVNYYYTDYDSQIVRTPTGGGNNLRANTEGFIHGVELQGALRLTCDWSLFTAGSYQFGKDTERNEPLSRIPPAFLSLGLRWNRTFPSYRLFWETWVEMADEQDRLSAADLNDIRIPIGGTAAWQTWNIRAGIDHANYGRLIVGVYNLLDRNYRFHGSGLDAPGFEARLGYELVF